MNWVSKNSELKARLARLAPVRDANRPVSSSDDGTHLIVLRRAGALDRPIDLIRRLAVAGVSLRTAHSVVNRLADLGWATCPVTCGEDLRLLANELARLNVQVRHRVFAEGTPDVAAMRARQSLSQREFADLLGIDLRTLQNWEQGRNRPDAAATGLMRVFAHAPDVVEEALSEPVVV